MRDTRYLSGLTPLRGIAAWWVVIFHYEATFGLLLPLRSSMLLRNGYLMVDLFFMLSGFVMQHSYGAQFREGLQRQALLRFAQARFARIYPLHLATLLVLVVWQAAQWLRSPELAFQGDFLPAGIPGNLLLVQALGVYSRLTWNYPAWSISAEWYVYGVFPVLAWGFARLPLRWRLLLAGAAVLAGYVLLAGQHPEGVLDLSYRLGFWRALAGFGAGMLIYAGYAAGLGAGWLRRDWSLGAAAGSLLVLLHLDVPDAAVMPGFAWLVWSAAANEGRLGRWLGGRGWQWLGDLSYSVYMWQYPWALALMGLGLLEFAPPDLAAGTADGSWPGLLGFAGGLLLLSQLSYRYLELPLRNWLKPKGLKRD